MALLFPSLGAQDEPDDGPLFRPGLIVVSPGAIEALSCRALHASDLLGRHLRGDWPLANPVERARNFEVLLQTHGQIVGRYILDPVDIERVTILTELDQLTLVLTGAQAETLLRKGRPATDFGTKFQDPFFTAFPPRGISSR